MSRFWVNSGAHDELMCGSFGDSKFDEEIRKHYEEVVEKLGVTLLKTWDEEEAEKYRLMAIEIHKKHFPDVSTDETGIYVSEQPECSNCGKLFQFSWIGNCPRCGTYYGPEEYRNKVE